MNLPPFLLGSVLLFWGWQTHLLLFAIPMALLLETVPWIKWRLELTDNEFNRLADFTSVLFILTAVYLLVQQSIYGLPTLLKWLPMLFFVLLAAQNFSSAGAIKLSSLVLSLRKTKAEYFITLQPNQQINISFPYMLICLLSASTSRSAGFFFGICWLIGWALWRNRPSRYPAIVWGILLILAYGLSYVGHQQLSYLQAQVEAMIITWFEHRFWSDRDPYRQNTAIGDFGPLKQSSRIVLRVNSPYPLLLREASYNTYYKTAWWAKSAQFSPVTPVRVDDLTWTWNFEPRFDNFKKVVKSGTESRFDNFKKVVKSGTESRFDNFKKVVKSGTTVQITGYLNQGKGMLALPQGTYQIKHTNLLKINKNNFGAVKVEEGPDLLNYTAKFKQATPLDTPPMRPLDLEIDKPERPLFIKLANQLHLYDLSPSLAIGAIQQFFTRQFRYSLTGMTTSLLTENALNATAQSNPLDYFLNQRRAGHCEYFATATVLLLRTIGIPARYATGYAVEEFSELEEVYLVRRRHAHAWTLAYVDGQWLELDTTPANWLEYEEELTDWWQPMYDVWSWLSYQYYKWRWRDSESSNIWIIGLIIPLLLILIWRVYKQKKVSRTQLVATATHVTTWPGTDSAFYQVIQTLIATGHRRLPGETVTAWIQKLYSTRPSPELQTMLALHLRYRFDPNGLNKSEQTTLTVLVTKWLAERTGVQDMSWTPPTTEQL